MSTIFTSFWLQNFAIDFSNLKTRNYASFSAINQLFKPINSLNKT